MIKKGWLVDFFGIILLVSILLYGIKWFTMNPIQRTFSDQKVWKLYLMPKEMANLSDDKIDEIEPRAFLRIEKDRLYFYDFLTDAKKNDVDKANSVSKIKYQNQKVFVVNDDSDTLHFKVKTNHQEQLKGTVATNDGTTFGYLITSGS